MSTKKTYHQGKSKYIRAEDIDSYIYESGDEVDLIECEQDAAQYRLKTALDKDSERNSVTSSSGKLDRSKNQVLNLKDKFHENYKTGNTLNSSFANEHSTPSTKLGSCESSVRKVKESEAEDNEDQDLPDELVIETGREATAKKRASPFSSFRKRLFPGDALSVDISKRFKSDIMSGVPVYKPLQLELDLETERSQTPVTRSTLEAVIEELDAITRRWKEGYARYRLPVQWGVPIVKTCSEKWSSHRVRTRMTYRNSYDSESSQRRVSESSSEMSDSMSESRNAPDRVVTGDGGQDYDQRTPDEESKESFKFDNGTLRVLRPRKENADRGDGGDELGTEEKSQQQQQQQRHKSKKHSSKDKKLNNSRRKLVVELERWDPMKYGSGEDVLDSNKNFDKLRIEDIGGSMSSSHMSIEKSHYDDKSNVRGGSEEEQVTCPICDAKFEKDRIENHATQCANMKFRD